ncbi:MAG TPA: peptidase MA family metallohydrolase [Candidatus Omnitrophota bacterium]|nr:peptidase MA family metallohydrolase [Candidatus Omnitrophota bacterium]HPT39803.1 peptidase MA family metallohydrolase [Candidatus Omnitrophota bacterium]
MPKLIRGVVALAVILLLPLVIFAQDQPWQVVKSTHFNIFYKHAPESELNAMVEKAEECYDSIAENFGFNRFNFWTWDNRAKIYLFDNQEEYLKSTQGYGWSGAQVRIDAKLIQSYVGSPGFLHNVLPHELAHIIFIEMVGYNNPAVPLWLHEGVASFQEKDIRVIKADLAERINSGDYLDFKALNSFEIRAADDAKVRLFYIESYSLVKYLVSEYGKEAFVNFCRNLRDSRNLTAALSKTYSIKNLQDFEESWKKFILK